MTATHLRARQVQPLRRLFPRGVAVLLLLPLAGCGSSEYSQEVERTRQRLACLDAERELLEDPAFLPDALCRIYFRPPRGVAVKPAEPANAGGDWLFHLPWSDGRALVPPLEVLVGTYRRDPQERVADFVQARLLDRLRAHADEKPIARPAGQGELTVTRWSEQPQFRHPIHYQRFAFHTDQEKPLWPAPRRADVPHRCAYNYDAYVTEADEHWAVVVFKLLDRAATEEAWKKAGVKAELIQRLPDWRPRRITVAVTEERILEPREASLATLLVGRAAEARLHLIGR